MSATPRPESVENFEQIASQWWDTQGPFAPLHRMTPARMTYIRDRVFEHCDRADLKNLSVLDAGCGGGLVCEPLARMGAKVTGLDAGEQAIRTAQEHARAQNLSIAYEQGLIDDHQGSYDVVLALEILEHVEKPETFLEHCARLCRPGGLLIVSTLNRTPQSFALGIVAAEYLLRWIPKGTHDWRKFIKPSEAAAMLRAQNCTVTDITGLTYNPLNRAFALKPDDPNVNYFLSAEKHG